MPRHLCIGTAGWSIPRASCGRCPSEGTHLQRYSRVFEAAEINSSFHRSHAPATYAKWAESTPPGFRFAVKVPRTITHDQQLRRIREPLLRFLGESAALGDKRGPLLVQLPPSLAFDARVAGRAFATLRAAHEGPVVCEPRHATWFADRAEGLLRELQIARVAADPPPVPGADRPGGWLGMVYLRLHGSPRKYWSKYDTSVVLDLAGLIGRLPTSVEAWCIFDNTASGAAIENAWELQQLVRSSATRHRPGDAS